MHFCSRRNRFLPVFLFIVLFSFAGIEYAGAQMNPFSMHSQTSAHMSFDWAKGFSNRANRSWDRYNQALAAAGGKDVMFRSQVAIGYIFTKASIRFGLHTTFRDEPVFDTTMQYTGEPVKNGIHVALSSGYPLATLSDDAALLLSYGLSYDELNWELPALNIPGREREFNYQSISFGVPLYLDYKWGAEAMLDISKHICFSAGAGVLPALTLNSGTTGMGHETRFTARPTARIEAGFATRFISLKLQATGIMGNMKIVDNPGSSYETEYGSDIRDNLDVRIVGHNQFIVSLVMIGSSAAWQYKPWFR